MENTHIELLPIRAGKMRNRLERQNGKASPEAPSLVAKLFSIAACSSWISWQADGGGTLASPTVKEGGLTHPMVQHKAEKPAVAPELT